MKDADLHSKRAIARNTQGNTASLVQREEAERQKEMMRASMEELNVNKMEILIPLHGQTASAWTMTMPRVSQIGRSCSHEPDEDSDQVRDRREG